MGAGQDVAVIGLPDERLGEIAAAIVRLKPGHTDTTEDDVNRLCANLPRAAAKRSYTKR